MLHALTDNRLLECSACCQIDEVKNAIQGANPIPRFRFVVRCIAVESHPSLSRNRSFVECIRPRGLIRAKLGYK